MSCGIEAEGPPDRTERGQEVRTRQAVGPQMGLGCFRGSSHIKAVTLAGVDRVLSATELVDFADLELSFPKAVR